MPTTSTPDSDSLRSDVAALTTLAARDLTGLWREVSDAVAARDALADVLPALVATYGAAAATVAADWYDDLRDKQGIGGRFYAIPAEVPDDTTDRLAASARVAVQPLFAPEPDRDWSSARTLAAGVLSRHVADLARSTVTGSSLADPRATGWQRTGAGACAFCAMLIGRGAVYSETTANFASHDHCNCSATPAWSGFTLPVKPFTPTGRNITPADRARVREYLRTN